MEPTAARRSLAWGAGTRSTAATGVAAAERLDLREVAGAQDPARFPQADDIRS